MNQLSKLQHTFQDCVLSSAKPASTAWVSAAGRATPETQLSIYSYAYRARLKEVLASDFSAVLMALGDERFDQLCNDYIATCPSHYFSLRDFGRRFPDFVLDLVSKNKSYLGMNWLYELAVFEWTLGQAFDAADAGLFSEQDMAAISPEAWPELRFTLHPSVQRLDFNWNTVELWQTLTGDEPEQVEAKQDNSSWIIWRHQLTTRFRSLEKDEQLALDKLFEGGSFNELCESLIEVMDEEEIPMRIATLLKSWISYGLIADVLLPDNKQ